MFPLTSKYPQTGHGFWKHLHMACDWDRKITWSWIILSLKKARDFYWFVFVKITLKRLNSINIAYVARPVPKQLVLFTCFMLSFSTAISYYNSEDYQILVYFSIGIHNLQDGIYVCKNYVFFLLLLLERAFKNPRFLPPTLSSLPFLSFLLPLALSLPGEPFAGVCLFWTCFLEQLKLL